LPDDAKETKKSDAHEAAGCAGPLWCSVQAGGFELAPLKQAKPLFPPGPALLGTLQGSIKINFKNTRSITSLSPIGVGPSEVVQGKTSRRFAHHA